MDPVALTDLSLSELQLFLANLGEPRFRAEQLSRWIYGSLAADFTAMANFPTALRDHLAQSAIISPVAIADRWQEDDGQTTKLLYRLRDGLLVEGVLMLDGHEDKSGSRATACVSSQVGCAIGCPFCATGQGGLRRNLTTGEIVGQVLESARLLATRASSTPRSLTNIVFMGEGEPLANWPAVEKAIRIVNDPRALGLGARHITISTAGIAPQIRKLAEFDVQVGLAVSLHAPTDDLRNLLVPINRRFPIAEVLNACRHYITATRRRVTFEYTLLHGINDSLLAARQLAALLRGMLCHVNLIPLNASLPGYRRSTRARVVAFQAELMRQGIVTTIRAERGGHIEAACGQLRARHATSHVLH